MPGRRKSSKKCGGGSTSEYGTYVWGTGNQQHAVGAGSNLIAAVNDPTTYKGGKRGARKSAKKGGNLVNIAVPAVLIAANQLYAPKKNIKEIKKGGSSDTPGDLTGIMQNMLKDMNNATNSINPTPTPIPTLVTLNELPSNVTAAVLKGGTTLTDSQPVGEFQQPMEIQPVVVGSGILTDIAAPALLIAANQLYKPKNRGTKKNKRTNKRKTLRI